MITHRNGPRTKLITIRVTPLEHEALIALADEDGRSVGDLVRHRLLRPSTCVVSPLPKLDEKLETAIKNLQAVTRAKGHILKAEKAVAIDEAPELT